MINLAVQSKMSFVTAIITALLTTAAAFRGSSLHSIARGTRPRFFFRSAMTSDSHDSSNQRDPIVLDDESVLTLPVFPLRKSVRLPTAFLTLNLYEERYLAMSEYILNQKLPLFGALYSSDKPQIIKQGRGPIVPMLERGDVGVLCYVKEWEEAMVPTQDPKFMRRRIRLNAIAVSRFRVIEITNNGRTTSPDPREFILVKASLIRDSALDNSEREKIAQLESTLRRRLQQITKEQQEIDETGLFEKQPKDTTRKEIQQGSTAESLVEEVSSIVSFKDGNVEDQKAETFSFAAASTLLPTGSSPQLLARLLQTTSTQQRLEQIEELE